MQGSNKVGTMKIGLWCNWIFVALTVIGWLGIACFINPLSGDFGMEETKDWFTNTHQWRVIIGCTIFYIAAGLLTPGSIAFGVMLSKVEGRRPLFSYTMAVCGVFISLIVFFNCCAWIVAAYRPEAGADVIQLWYDWAWFAFLLGWIYLAIEMVATAIVELQDDRSRPMIPRWFTWLTFAGAAGIFFAAGPAFTKSGPFAYDGELAFYLPVLIWGAYISVTTWFMMQELKREKRDSAESVAWVSGVANDEVEAGDGDVVRSSE